MIRSAGSRQVDRQGSPDPRPRNTLKSTVQRSFTKEMNILKTSIVIIIFLCVS